MIVPDFTPLSGSHPASMYHGIMMSMMDQSNNYGSFIGRSQPLPIRSPPHMRRSPPHLVCSSPTLLKGTESLVRRPDFRIGQAFNLHVPAVTTQHISSKSDSMVSPISSEGGSGLSPSSEVSQIFVSSEDGDGGSTESSQREKDEGGDRKAFKCPQCLYFTDRKNNLKRHIVTMHQECSKTLECCGVVFHSKAALRDHVGLFHRGGYRCQICSRNFCRKALLRRHLTVHSGRKDFSCNLCGYATSHKSNLERHQKVHLRRPSCPQTRENNHDALPSQPSPDKKVTTRYYPKFGYHRERTLNRFVLLPNRLKYTHDITRDTAPADRRCCKSVSPLRVQDVENSVQLDEDIPTEVDSEVRHSETNKAEIPEPLVQMSTAESRQFDTEVQIEVHKFSKVTAKRSTSASKVSLLSSKRRIFVTPYKCSDCGVSFSNQADFHGHVCRTVRNTHDVGLSVITAVRKGKIKLLPQRDPSNKNQQITPDCANDIEPCDLTNMPNKI